MIKLFNLLKSSGAFIIYIWLATTIVGLLSWNYTSRLSKPSIKSDLMIDRLFEFFKPSPILLWIGFTVVLIIAILLTIDWVKDKGSSKRK
ncbi:hypothetical protein ACN0TX_12005 [Staphylococcus cohnii]|uniref:hypothetical protein n=1 Tax=Staphylococcus cohnii TaxID=29382 RepID=UPI003AF92109